MGFSCFEHHQDAPNAAAPNASEKTGRSRSAGKPGRALSAAATAGALLALYLGCQSAGPRAATQVSLPIPPNSTDTLEVPAAVDDFASFARKFAASWDGTSLEAIERLLVGSWGLWVFDNPGNVPHAARHKSLLDARGRGVGKIDDGISFECMPIPGTAPDFANCPDTAGNGVSRCEYGNAKPVLTAPFTTYMHLNVDPSPERDQMVAGGEHMRQIETGDVRYLTSSTRSAVFYFARHRDAWRLVAIDIARCYD